MHFCAVVAKAHPEGSGKARQRPVLLTCKVGYIFLVPIERAALREWRALRTFFSGPLMRDLGGENHDVNS